MTASPTSASQKLVAAAIVLLIVAPPTALPLLSALFDASAWSIAAQEAPRILRLYGNTLLLAAATVAASSRVFP